MRHSGKIEFGNFNRKQRNGSKVGHGMPCPYKLFAQRLTVSEVTMIAFEVFLNGNKVCRAGVGDLGVLTTVLSWVRREGRNTETKEPGNIEEELTLNVSGLLSAKKEHVR